MTRAPLMVGVAAVLLFGGGCEDDDTGTWVDEYSYVWEGEHVTVYGYERSEADACGGSFEALETHTRALMDFFGTDESLHYNYRWMSHDFWQGHCPPGASACTARGEPWARELPHMHEIAHAVPYISPNTVGPSLLREGLAEYFAETRFDGGTSLQGEVSELLTAVPVKGQFYTRAGHFASFLVENFGANAVVQLYVEIPFYNTISDWEAAVPRVLDMSLDDLLEEYESYPFCNHSQYRARLWECDGEPDFVFTPETDTFTLEASCADSRAMGVTDGTAMVTRRILFTEDTNVWVTMHPQGTAVATDSFVSQECLPCSAKPHVSRVHVYPTLLTYPAGLHEIVVFVDSKHGDAVTMEMVRP